MERDEDIFDELPWLCPPADWHPEAPALVEPARALRAMVPDDPSAGLELWALLGSVTRAPFDERAKCHSALSEALQCEDTVPGWPVVAGCLLRLMAAPVPGRHDRPPRR